MRIEKRYLSSVLLAFAFLAPLATSGCAGHAYYRVYDPYDHNYHRWTPAEDSYYHRWESEDHREDRDYRRLSAEEQRQYWAWRHQHHDRDHDHDHGHDRD
jgi:hypothetical protein